MKETPIHDELSALAKASNANGRIQGRDAMKNEVLAILEKNPRPSRAILDLVEKVKALPIVESAKK